MITGEYIQVSEATQWKRVSNFFNGLLPECWNYNAEARLSVLRIKKDLTKLQDELAAKSTHSGIV